MTLSDKPNVAGTIYFQLYLKRFPLFLHFVPQNRHNIKIFLPTNILVTVPSFMLFPSQAYSGLMDIEPSFHWTTDSLLICRIEQTYPVWLKSRNCLNDVGSGQRCCLAIQIIEPSPLSPKYRFLSVVTRRLIVGDNSTFFSQQLSRSQ